MCESRLSLHKPLMIVLNSNVRLEETQQVGRTALEPADRQGLFKNLIHFNRNVKMMRMLYFVTPCLEAINPPDAEALAAGPAQEDDGPARPLRGRLDKERQGRLSPLYQLLCCRAGHFGFFCRLLYRPSFMKNNPQMLSSVMFQNTCIVRLYVCCNIQACLSNIEEVVGAMDTTHCHGVANFLVQC